MHAVASRFQPLIEHSNDFLTHIVFYKICPGMVFSALLYRRATKFQGYKISRILQIYIET